MEEFKSGFGAIIGRSNVGKSTLLNLLVRRKSCNNSKQATNYKNSY